MTTHLSFDDAAQALKIAQTLSAVLNDPKAAGERIAQAASLLDQVVRAEAALNAQRKVWDEERRLASEELMGRKVAAEKDQKARAAALAIRQGQIDTREAAVAAVEKANAAREAELAQRAAALDADMQDHEDRRSALKAALG